MRLLFAALALAGAAFCASAQAQPAGHPRDVLGHLRASWYDCKKPGQCSRNKRTASGETFKPNGKTCAHRRLPFNTMLRVTYRGRTVLCRVNDRGPFIAGRDLDMAAGVAQALGFLGVNIVRVEIVR